MGYLDLERQLAEAQAELTTMREEHAIWEIHGFVQIVTERDALKATVEQAREALTVAWAECLRGFCVRGEPLPRPGYPSLRETVESTLAAPDAGKEAGR